MLRERTSTGTGEVYQNWCDNCIHVYHPLMLTGYCLSSGFDDVIWHCDNCGRASDLAMVKVNLSQSPNHWSKSGHISDEAWSD